MRFFLSPTTISLSSKSLHVLRTNSVEDAGVDVAESFVAAVASASRPELLSLEDPIL